MGRGQAPASARDDGRGGEMPKQWSSHPVFRALPPRAGCIEPAERIDLCVGIAFGAAALAGPRRRDKHTRTAACVITPAAPQRGHQGEQLVVRIAGLAYPRHVSEEVDLLAGALGAAGEVYLFLDYGGTLAPGIPGEIIHPEPGVIEKLEQLGEEDAFQVFVLSGKTVAELDSVLGVENIGLIGQGGFEIRRPYSDVEYPVDPESLGGLIHHLELAAHGRLDHFRGIKLENRGFALTLHLSGNAPDTDREASREFLKQVRELDSHHQLEVLYGSRSVEARMAGWHKSDAVRYILQSADIDDALAIYIGDDVTDEEAFEVVRVWSEDDEYSEPWFLHGDGPEDEEPPHALTILVADRPRPTMASMFVRGPGEVYEFLSSLAAIATAIL
jgi:trehalose 6-phosphate phosphatase